MRIPSAPLKGFFARAWALQEQEIGVILETVADPRHFRIKLTYPSGRLERQSVLLLGDDPDSLLDDLERALKQKGISFVGSRTYIARVNAEAESG